MLQLHFYSNHAGRLVLGGGSNDWWSSDTYPLDSIKEFEQISEAWKKCLADLLKKGYFCMCKDKKKFSFVLGSFINPF